ncbi:tetratricopeptide repeat protein [Nitzschia inconspicua]|uniref:Tetratricopeptide repeat protein n=1 Tax=Nitzschia inconspicua TaxID=303405 RepID=A0A9K3PVL7_9STRA|nr:tetratricopeptide repeat protein [Nitzschia inconspicua]
MATSADHILEKAVIRCKKAQSVARPYSNKKKVKAGATVETKLAEMVAMTKKDDFGELTAELELLEQLVTNMQKGVLEPLLDSIETIERRMKSYQNVIHGNQDEFDESTKDSLPDFESQHESNGRDGHSSHKNGNSEHKKDDEEITGVAGDGCPSVAHERFLDKLNHFFEFQRTAEERLSIVDPQGKIAAMKVKSHSKGIMEKNGTFKAGYRQQDIKGKPVRHLTDLYQAAESAKPAFEEFLNSLIVALDFTKDDLIIAPLKPRARASQKAREEYTYRIPGPAESWLYDILRASIVVKSYKQISDINRYLKENVHIVECENRFTMPQFDGYRDILYYISIPYKDELAFVCELQIHQKEFKQYFGVNSHKSSFCQYFAGPFRDRVETIRDLDMLQQVGKVDGNLMEFLLEANDSNQLKLFARIFFEQLEETEKALELFKRVLTMEESSFGKGHVITGSTYQYLGQVLLSRGDADGALIYLSEAEKVLSKNLGARNPEVATVLTTIGDAQRTRGDFSESLREHKKALEIREEALGEDHQLVAESYVNVAQALGDKGDTKRGIAECRTALIIQESMIGENGVELAPTYIMLGKLQFKQGEASKALECLNKALELQEGAYGKKHLKIAETLDEIGNVKLEQGELDGAESSHRKALQIREQMLSKGHPDCAISYGHLGLVLSQRGDKEGALVVLRLALKIRTHIFGKNHLLTSNCYKDIGTVMAENDDVDGAMHQLKECLTIRKGLCGRNHPLVAEVINHMGRIKTNTGDAKGGISDHDKALAILEKVVGSNHPDVADTLQYMGEAYQKDKNQTKALENHSRALSIRSGILGKQHPATASSCVAIAGILEAKKDLPGAKMAYRQALTACLTSHGENHFSTATVRLRLGRILNREQEFTEAEEEVRKAIALLEEIAGEGDLRTAEGYALLGTILNRQSKFEEALSFHEKSLEIRKEQLGDSHPDSKVAEAAVAINRAGKHEDEIAL